MAAPLSRRQASAALGKPAAPPAGDVQAANHAARWIILVGLITAAVMEVLDTTIINVALPQMAGNLNATSDEIAWVSTGYILSNVVVLPMTAWLSQRFGRKNYLSLSIILFIVASFFCGTSDNLLELVFWRVLQGAGGAALLSTAQATLRQVFPKEEQGTVQTLFILGIVVAPTIGPTLGGVITDNYHWSWVFFINIPVGLVSLALVWFYLHDTQTPNRAAPIDYMGIILLTIGLGCLQYVLEEGERDDWFSSVAIQQLSVIAAVTLIAMLVWELSPRNKHPVVDFRVLRNKNFSAGLVMFLVLGFGLYGGIFIFPLFTQNVLGFSPTATGLVLLPGGLATAVAAMLCGRLLNGPKKLVQPRVLVVIGMSLFMWSMWQLGHLSIMSGEPDTRIALIVRGFGLGFLFTPLNNVIFATLKGPEVAQGSSFVNLFRQLGGSFGIAVLNTYIVNQTTYHRTDLVTNISRANIDVAQRQAAAAANLIAHGYSAVTAQTAALGTINGSVQSQALVMSYNDGFLLLGLSFLFAAPSILLLHAPKGGGAPVGGGGGH